MVIKILKNVIKISLLVLVIFTSCSDWNINPDVLKTSSPAATPKTDFWRSNYIPPYTTAINNFATSYFLFGTSSGSFIFENVAYGMYWSAGSIPVDSSLSFLTFSDGNNAFFTCSLKIVYRSDNNGFIWYPVLTLSAQDSPGKINMIVYDKGYLYVGGKFGNYNAYVSQNFGTTWSKTNIGDSASELISLAFSNYVNNFYLAGIRKDSDRKSVV
jgi:hypothetical protein